jgi:hypothetical protein
MMPASRPAQVRMPRRATSISPTPSFVDSNRRGVAVHDAPLATSPIVRCIFSCVKMLAPTRRYFAFLRPPFRFAVLRAVFFAADFVFDFDFFAILPS